jgi:nickel-dependent lactate racemase
VAAGTTSRGNASRLNRAVMEADLVIFTGFIEPHFFAGFSGGHKGALPALAGHERVLTNHGYAMIGDPRATWGIHEGNPIWEEMREAALLVEPLFLLNVTLNAGGELTGVFAGDVIEAHRRGCAFVRDSAMVPVEEPFDAVVTTNSGYPLDQNLYQTVKGMQAAKGIVRAGGAIVLAAACEDGLPRHGRYAELLAEAGSPDAILDSRACLRALSRYSPRFRIDRGVPSFLPFLVHQLLLVVDHRLRLRAKVAVVEPCTGFPSIAPHP